MASLFWAGFVSLLVLVLRLWITQEWDTIALFVGRLLSELGVKIAPPLRRDELSEHFRAIVDERGAVVSCGLGILWGACGLRLQVMRRGFGIGTAVVLASGGILVLVVYREKDVTQKWRWLRVCVRVRRCIGGSR